MGIQGEVLLAQMEQSGFARPAIWFGLIGAFLAAINNVVATVGLGFAQAPVVAFTTPFAFCLARLGAPRLPAATLVYVPVVVVSFFTLNFGPPGFYKVGFLLGAVAYDAVCYLTGVGIRTSRPIPMWKFLLANAFYPIGLLAAGLIAVSWVSVSIPILSRGLPGAIALVAVFVVIGSGATWLCHRVYPRLAPELSA